MGKRMRGQSLSSAESILRLRLISSNLAASSLTTDEVAAHLRFAFREYSRLPRNIFANNVERILASLRQQRNDDDEFEERKSARKSGGDSMSNYSSTSTSVSVDNDDVASNAKTEPKFDLMKSMLRDNYVEKNKPARKPAPEMENNMEIQTGGKDGRKLDNDEVLRNIEAAATSNGLPTFDDLGGINELLEQLEHKVLAPLCHPKLLERVGMRPMDGILLHGPPGCGKTKLARAIANEAGVPFYQISAAEVVSGVTGASEENIRDLFKKAHMTAPSIVFIDEIDAIASKRENMQKEMEKRIVTQLLTCMDEYHQTHQSNNNNDLEGESSETKPMPVLVIGATNRLNALDQALRRPGRFGREITLGVPDENARFEILSVLIKKLRIEDTFDLMKIARSTPGFVGADLAALVDEACYLALKRITLRRKVVIQAEKIRRWWRLPWPEEEMNGVCVSMSDFQNAVTIVQNSSTREGFSSIPSTKWDDIGGLDSLRKEFEHYIIERIKKPEDQKEFGMDMAVGFLLFGPPGCGKTLIAKAVANEAGASFIHIKGPELLNKYVGESELAIRTIFTRARTCSPCILFFDEVDALTTQRGQDGGWVVNSVLRQLLVELDGADPRQDVFVIGATNRPEVMDPALLRPGRFGKAFYVALPTADERSLILKAIARGKPIAADVDLDAIARSDACRNLTGADLSAMMNDAAMAAYKERQNASMNGSSYGNRPPVIEKSHLETALMNTAPSVKRKERIHYKTLAKKFQSKR